MAQTEGRLISISEISRAVNVDKSFENSRATIVLDNINNFLTETEADHYLKGKPIKIYEASEGQRVEIQFPSSGWRYFSAIARTYTTGDLIFSGEISDMPRSDQGKLTIIADVETTGLDLEVNRTISKDDYPNVPLNNEGKYGNIVYGTADDASGKYDTPGILTAYRVDANKYLAAWNTLNSLIKCYSSAGVDITGSCVLSVVAGISYILYTSSDEYIYFNAYGTYSGGSLIDNPAEMLDEINTDFGYWTIDGIADAAAIFASRAWTGNALIVNDNITWSAFFQEFCKCYDCHIFMQADGHLKIKALDWGGETAILTIDNGVDQIVEGFACWRDLTEIIDEYKRKYWYHFREGEYQREPVDVQAATSWEATTGTLEQKYIKDAATSQDATTRVIFFKKNPTLYYNFKLPKRHAGGTYALNLELGDVISIKTVFNNFYPTEARLIQIYRKKHISNSNMIEFEGIDVTGILGNMIILYDDLDPLIVLLKDEADPDCHVLL